jgi:transcriptional regulator GlxA family with amidase domain
MSIRNFNRLFRSETGRTPADFVESARVEKAKRLLEESETPLQKVSAFCGFTNVDTMRRAFLRRTGINPSDYKLRFPQSEKH